MADTFDLIVVGGGPGGYVAAIRASQLEMKGGLVQRAGLGGICLNWGCIPTKALLRASEINHMLHDLDAYGFAADNIRFDFNKVVKRSRGVAAQLSGGVKHLMKKNKITVFDGHAKLAGAGTISVTKDGKPVAELAAPHIILATGARARVIPGMEPDGKLIWSYREAMVPAAMPKSLIVVGSGAIGSEFASFYQNMGAKVTLVEVMDRILPVEDTEISAFVQKAFAKQGMTIMTGARVQGVRKGADSVTAIIEAGGKVQEVTADRLISAVGIVGNVEDLGLEGTKIVVDRTHVVTDAMGQTGEPGIYAIGDLTGAPWLAHKASHEGTICVENIAGLHPHAMDILNIPGCTYCRPQVASVGLTEAAAKARGHEVRVGRFPFLANGKAIAMGEPEGLVKTVFDAGTGELLGAHMVGPEVTEMIQGYCIARTLESTEADLMHTVFPHPTVSETMHESVLDAYGRVIHI
ncbi:MAG: dihydrolipoyl dehydrogenase [Rubritepida sp.]|nr:dihydrolipoyl dehydrogenase [Rubritepida sp.]